MAKAIVNSPLMKTAVHGADPNWGRVVMAVGKSGEEADRDKLKIWFGEHLVASNGEATDGIRPKPISSPFRQYSRETDLTAEIIDRR